MVRARDLGIEIGTGTPGPKNAITDVEGVLVGHITLIEGEGDLVVGQGPVRTGVTMIVPHNGRVGEEPLFAGCHRLNGNGELTGLEWIRESGMLTTPIGITNTHSVGVVRDAIIAAEVRNQPPGGVFWSLPVVGETWDGALNDINGFHVKPEHALAALDAAASGPVAEGCVGGGTGMICHDFKGGIGTASRVVGEDDGGYTVGVLVQANYGERSRLSVNGVPVGREITAEEVPVLPDDPLPGAGSIIAMVATDAPLIPTQCDRLAQRAGLGIARMGGLGGHTSGDIFLCFATGNSGLISSYKMDDPTLSVPVKMLSNNHITPLFEAVVEATEEAILNAMVSATTTTGINGHTVYALPHDRLVEVMEKYRPRA
jgi:D-aminopeptidase